MTAVIAFCESRLRAIAGARPSPETRRSLAAPTARSETKSAAWETS
jgi:hypothetical protein